MRRITLLAVGALGLLACSGLRRAHAFPIVSLNNAAEFQAGINDGSLVGVDPTGVDPRTTLNLTALNRVYAANNTVRNTVLGTNTTLVNGLVSATGTAVDKNSRIIGAYSYKGSDPDYTNFFIDLDLFFPQVGAPGTSGIDTMAFTVFDSADRLKSWQWDNTVLTQGFQNFFFPFSGNSGAGGSTSFFVDPGFDLTTVTMLQVSYRGTLTDNFPLPPPTLTPVPSPSLWIGDHILAASVPEPGALPTFALAAFSLLVWKRRLKKRANSS